MEQAIKRAIEGGLKEGENWKFVRANKYWAIWLDGNDTETTIAVEKYLLDPLFWQALSKAEEWEVENHVSKIWIWHWHRFIDKIASGGTPDEFFKELLK